MTPWMHLLPLELAVLALAALVLLLDALLDVPGRALGWLTALGLLGVLAASFVLDVSGAAPHGAYASGPWVLFFKRTFLCAGALSVLGSIEWLHAKTPRRQAEYYLLLLLSLTGMMLLPGARDWVLLVITFELMGVPLYVLAAWHKTDDAENLGAEAGLKLFITGAASSGFTLFGLALVTGLSGSTSIAAQPAGPLAPLATLGMMMVLAGFAFKVGAVPFHFWVPDTYQGAPTPFVAFLSVAPKVGGIGALAVVLLSGWERQADVWVPAVIFLSAASMVVGNLMALPQSDVRRLLGFSGISQIGYVLVALAAHTERSIGMALFFLATYVFTNLGVFLVVHAAAENAEGHAIGQLAGLSRRSPWLGAALLVFLLSLAGIPFVVGFWAKLFVFMAAYQAGLFWLVLAGVALAVVGLFYYLQVARSTFMAEGNSDAPIAAPFALKASIAACLAAVIGFGLYPQPLLGAAMEAAKSFLSG